MPSGLASLCEPGGPPSPAAGGIVPIRRPPGDSAVVSPKPGVEKEGTPNWK
jgi:hypothetical protein